MTIPSQEGRLISTVCHSFHQVSLIVHFLIAMSSHKAYFYTPQVAWFFHSQSHHLS
jgi:hypothetical protein